MKNGWKQWIHVTSWLLTCLMIPMAYGDWHPMTQFFNAPMTYVDVSDLPEVPKFLLTQDLLTPAISDYYGRTPNILPPLERREDKKNNVYYRTIMMVIDNDKKRNDALKAHALHESTVVELALITVYFSSLPHDVIEAVQKADTPFGTILMEHNIPTKSIDHQYFSVPCAGLIAQYVPCEGKRMYGRMNTLIRDDNKKMVAEVVQILTDVDM